MHRLLYGESGYQTQSEGYAESKPLGFIPQVKNTHSYFDSNYGVMNEYNLMIGECTCGAKNQPGPDQNKRLFYSAELSRIALERCTTAREAIILMSQLIAQYGYYGTGETLLIGDANEGWVMEMAAYEMDGSDGIWVAQRVEDDQYFVAANEFRIRDIKKGKTTDDYGISSFDDNEVWYSLNLFDVPKAKNWNILNDTIDWLSSVSWGEYSHPYYSLRRVWRAFSKVAPSSTVWLGMSETTGGSFKLLTVNVAGSESVSKSRSVAVKVIVSLPFQLISGIVIVATRAVISTVNSVLPE